MADESEKTLRGVFSLPGRFIVFAYDVSRSEPATFTILL